ncbi:hypothetical protein P4668_25440 [Priestia megaterium]|uniref:hypothetical protein n=1 Tax=Priestia megaterium TaxID=1404 RepID=UPI002E2413F3|nr:hypothetical protein [Priestia megaterium]
MTFVLSLVAAYFIISIFGIAILKLIEIILNEFKNNFFKIMADYQENCIKNDNKPKLVQSIRFEFLLENIFLFIIPYFPDVSINSLEEDMGSLIRKRNKYRNVVEYFLYRLSPFRLINFIIIILLLELNGISMMGYLKIVYTWIIEHFATLKSLLLIVPSSIALLLILMSYFFTSRKGLLARAKNKINLEDFETIVKFHKKNRMLLSEITLEGYRNINWVFHYRKNLIKAFKQKQTDKFNETCNRLYDSLEKIPKIAELDAFVSENDKYKDLYPFIFMGVKHLSVYKLQSMYNNIGNPKSRLNKLNGTFCTKDAVKNQIDFLVKYNQFEEGFNKQLLHTLKNAIIIEKYLNKIHPQFRKNNSLFFIVAFITNKDK